jgi:hypothetical protein
MTEWAQKINPLGSSHTTSAIRFGLCSTRVWDWLPSRGTGSGPDPRAVVLHPGAHDTHTRERRVVRVGSSARFPQALTDLYDLFGDDLAWHKEWYSRRIERHHLCTDPTHLYVARRFRTRGHVD